MKPKDGLKLLDEANRWSHAIGQSQQMVSFYWMKPTVSLKLLTEADRRSQTFGGNRWALSFSKLDFSLLLITSEILLQTFETKT